MTVSIIGTSEWMESATPEQINAWCKYASSEQLDEATSTDAALDAYLNARLDALEKP